MKRLNWFVLWASVVLPTMLASTAAADVITFKERHDFKLSVDPGPGQVVGVTWRADVNGTAFDTAGPFRFTTRYPPPPAPNPLVVAPQPAPLAMVHAGSTTAGATTAKSSSEVNIAADGTGFHEVKGELDFPATGGGKAFANSSVGLNVGAVNGRGAIRWRPNWAVNTIGAIAAPKTSRSIDPIDFTVMNLDTLEIFQSRLFEVDVQVSNGAQASWVDGLVTMDGLQGSGSLLVNMVSPFITSPQGMLSVAFANGIVTDSTDTGVFDGLLPSVGSQALFDFMVGNAGDIDIGFDFGPTNVNGFQFDVDLGAGGVVSAPEPGTLLLIFTGTAGLVARYSRRRHHRRLPLASTNGLEN